MTNRRKSKRRLKRAAGKQARKGKPANTPARRKRPIAVDFTRLMANNFAGIDRF